jgi:hypothetical protein
MSVKFVGGPADGQAMEGDFHKRPSSTVEVPIAHVGGFHSFKYTLRKCKDRAGNTVLVLAPAGRAIDPSYLKANGLTN